MKPNNLILSLRFRVSGVRFREMLSEGAPGQSNADVVVGIVVGGGGVAGGIAFDSGRAGFFLIGNRIRKDF